MDSHCPTLSARMARMKSRVTLEPELQEIAALWPPAKRLEAAAKMLRWARQLKVSAFIMLRDAKPFPRRLAVPTLPHRKAALN
jgi:hypothetical protein